MNNSNKCTPLSRFAHTDEQVCLFPLSYAFHATHSDDVHDYFFLASLWRFDTLQIKMRSLISYFRDSIFMSHVSRTFLVTLVFILSLPTLTWAESKAIPYDTVTVRMRDGITLSTDIYRHSDNISAPTILVRTPYNKRGVQSTAARFVAAGYSFVVQDCRGRFESQGTFIPYNNEGQDGYDTIEWLQHQPWCNGRIAMWGSSYVGATQWQAAVEHPPGLVTILPTATWSSFYRNLYLGGAVRLSLIATWAGGNSDRPANIGLPTDWDSTLMHLPLSEMDQKMGWSIPSVPFGSINS